MCQFHAKGCISEDIYKNLQLLFNTTVLISLSIHLSIYLVKQLAFNINCASDTGLIPEKKILLSKEFTVLWMWESLKAMTTKLWSQNKYSNEIRVLKRQDKVLLDPRYTETDFLSF